MSDVLSPEGVLGFTTSQDDCEHHSAKPRTGDFCADCGMTDKVRFATYKGETFRSVLSGIAGDSVSEIIDAADMLVHELDLPRRSFDAENRAALRFALTAAATGMRITVTATDK